MEKKDRLFAKVLRMAGIVIAFSIALYVIYAVILYIQFSSNYNKWVRLNIKNYSILVSYGKSGLGGSSQQLETVKDGKFAQKAARFNKPTIDWAFEQAKSCISAWIMCFLFKWSFQYDSTYGYPSTIEYDEYDGHFVIMVSDLTLFDH